jgi:hypothetical protein
LSDSLSPKRYQYTNLMGRLFFKALKPIQSGGKKKGHNLIPSMLIFIKAPPNFLTSFIMPAMTA